MKIIPRGKYVLVKPDEKELIVNEAGLSSPENEEVEPKSTGTVIESGDVKDINKGNEVVFGVLAGETIQIKGVDYKLLHDEDIIAFIE